MAVLEIALPIKSPISNIGSIGNGSADKIPALRQTTHQPASREYRWFPPPVLPATRGHVSVPAPYLAYVAIYPPLGVPALEGDRVRHIATKAHGGSICCYSAGSLRVGSTLASSKQTNVRDATESWFIIAHGFSQLSIESIPQQNEVRICPV